VGFSTYDGSVSAARRWDGARETMSVNPGLAESYEQLLHEVSFRTPQPAAALPAFMLLLRSLAPTTKLSAAVRLLHSPPRLQRAIGVQYVKQTERQSHYFRAVLPQQFDAMLHFDRTSYLRPLMAADTEMQIEEEAEDADIRPASEDEDEEMEG
jgi:erythromycin esterase-like protein